TVPDRGFARLITNLSISGRFQGAREPPPRVTAGSVRNRPPDDRFESRRRPPPPTGLRPGEQVIDRTKAVGNPVLPAVTDAPEPPRIIVLEGDQTGQELLDQARRLLEPDVCRVDLEFEHYDLSLANRRRTGNEVVVAAARVMREAGYGLKAATITPEGPDDVG